VPGANYPSLQALVRELLVKAKTPIERACFDVAGPVIVSCFVLISQNRQTEKDRVRSDIE
jgi:glucokinase